MRAVLKNPRVRLIIAIAALALLGGGLAFKTGSVALSAEASCDQVMERTPSYGPWVFESKSVRDGKATLRYSDGYMGAGCTAQRYGPFWVKDVLMTAQSGCLMVPGGDPTCKLEFHGVAR